MSGGRSTIRVRLPHPDVLRRFCEEQLRGGTLFVGARETLEPGLEVVVVFQLEGVERDLKLNGSVIPPPDGQTGTGVNIRFDDPAQTISAAESYLAFGEAVLEDAAEEQPERRKHPRVSARARVRLRLHDSERFRDLFTKDLSRGGMFVVSQDPRPPGTEVEVLLVPPGREEPLLLSGLVTHAIFPSSGSRDRPGMGLRLTVPPEVQEVLDEVLREVVGVGPPADTAETPTGIPEEDYGAADEETAAPSPEPTQPPIALVPEPSTETPPPPEEPEEIILVPDDSGDVTLAIDLPPEAPPEAELAAGPSDAAGGPPAAPSPELGDEAPTVAASPEELGAAPGEPSGEIDLAPPPRPAEAELVRLELEPSDASRFREVYTRDIARGGVFIYTRDLHPLGSRVQVVFRAPGFSDEFLLSGEVAHVVSPGDPGTTGAPGMGIRLDPLEQPAQQRIEEVLSLMLDAELDGFDDPGRLAAAEEALAASSFREPAPPPVSEPPAAPPSAGAPWNQYFGESTGPESARPGDRGGDLGSAPGPGTAFDGDFGPAAEPTGVTQLSPPPPEAMAAHRPPAPAPDAPKQRVVHESGQHGGARVSRHANPSAPGGVTMVLQYESLEAMRHAYDSDISKGGVFLPTAEALPLRSQCQILLVPPDAEEGIPLTGEVVHVLPVAPGGTGGGMGIQIVDLTGARRQMVAQMLEGRSGIAGTVSVASVREAGSPSAAALDDDIPMVDLEEVVLEDEAAASPPSDPRLAWPPPSFGVPPEPEPRVPASPQPSPSPETPQPAASTSKPKQPVSKPKQPVSKPKQPVSKPKQPASKEEAEIDRLLDAEFAQFPNPPPPPNVKPYQPSKKPPASEAPSSPSAPEIPTAPWASEHPPAEDESGGPRFAGADARELLSTLEKSLRRSYFDTLGVKPYASRERISNALEQKRRPFLESSYPQGVDNEARELLAVGRERLAHVEETLFDARRRATYECSQGLYVEDDDDRQPEGKALRQQVRLQFRERFTVEFPEKVRKAEEYFRSASDDRRAGKLSAALLNVKLAISYDPLCETYHQLLREIEKKS